MEISKLLRDKEEASFLNADDERMPGDPDDVADDEAVSNPSENHPVVNDCNLA